MVEFTNTTGASITVMVRKLNRQLISILGKPHFTHTQEPHKVSEPVPGEYEALNIVRTSSAAVRDMLVKLGIDPKHENAIFEFGVEMYKQGIAEALRQAQKIINQLGGKDGTPQS